LGTRAVRGAAVAAELASSGRLDPATGLLLADGAFEALGLDDWSGTAGEREEVESGLTAILRTVLDDPEEVAALQADPVAEALLADLPQAWYPIQLARRFHNLADAQTQRVHRKLLIRCPC